jgi:hypothetical protein
MASNSPMTRAEVDAAWPQFAKKEATQIVEMVRDPKDKTKLEDAVAFLGARTFAKAAFKLDKVETPAAA